MTTVTITEPVTTVSISEAGAASVTIVEPVTAVTIVEGALTPDPVEAFVGAYDDIPNIVAAYGMRRLLSSYESNLIRIRRSSDQVESDFGYVENGDLDVAAVATFLGGGSGLITTLYDQKNGNDAIQTTAASQPLYVASGQNSLPVLRWDGTDDSFDIAANIFGVAATSSLFVMKRSANQFGGIITSKQAGRDDSPAIDLLGDGKLMVYYSPGGKAATQSSADSLDTWYLYSAELTDTGATLWRDGTQSVTNTWVTNAIAPAATNKIGAYRVAESLFFAGDIAELVIANAVWSTADRQAAETAANSYWGVF